MIEHTLATYTLAETEQARVHAARFNADGVFAVSTLVHMGDGQHKYEVRLTMTDPFAIWLVSKASYEAALDHPRSASVLTEALQRYSHLSSAEAVELVESYVSNGDH